ncbi:MAG: hypothetical protein CRU78_05900 [Candidatus Accumulibacter phosphatis]|mgnify:CR=1 FL=1|uniref:Uncharacterized protein n=1 Tax=Candidatus Accumulibacter phosphatis TaxID=327160 RepID=A0A6A7RT66_9PROT|nr:hypothetical protein [Candidatus Accumulibacter phosphatis]
MTEKTISAEAARRIATKVGDAGAALKAMHDLAICHENGVSSDTLSIAVEIMAKDAFRTLDACLIELGSIPGGCFSGAD